MVSVVLVTRSGEVVEIVVWLVDNVVWGLVVVTVVLDEDWGLVVVRVVAAVEEVVSELVVVTGLGLVLVVVWGEVELIVAPVVLVVDSVRVITRVKAHIFHSKPYLYPPGLSGSLHID